MAELVYVDETEMRPIKKRPATHLMLVAVVIDDTSVRAMAEQMEDLRRRSRPAPTAKDFEFHGQDLWHQTGPWIGKSEVEVIEIFDGLIGILEGLKCFVAHSTIDLDKLHERHSGMADENAYRLALQFLLEKVDAYPSYRASRIVIVDEKHEEKFRAIRMVGNMQKFGSGEVPGRKLTTVIDNVHFIDSAASPGVQLADVVAFIMQRRRLRRVEHPNAQAALDRWSTVITERTTTWREPWPR